MPPFAQAKLLAAMSLYSMQARGPASEKLAEVLAAECLAYWQVPRYANCQLQPRKSLISRRADKCARNSP